MTAEMPVPAAQDGRGAANTTTPVSSDQDAVSSGVSSRPDGEDLRAELGRIADKVEREANQASRWGQSTRLEAIANRLRIIAERELAGWRPPLPAASLEVDTEADAWYVRILDEDVHHATESAPVNLDWTRDGRLVGIELLGPLRRGASERTESAERCVSWLYSEREDKVYWPDPMIIDLWYSYAPTHEEIHESDLPDDVTPLLPPAAVSAGMRDAEATIRELTAAVAGKDGYIGMLRRQRDDAESASRLAEALSVLRLGDVDRLRAERDEARAKLDTVRKVLDEPDFRHPKHLLDFDTSGELGDCLDDCPGCAVDAIRRIVVGEVQR